MLLTTTAGCYCLCRKSAHAEDTAGHDPSLSNAAAVPVPKPIQMGVRTLIAAIRPAPDAPGQQQQQGEIEGELQQQEEEDDRQLQHQQRGDMQLQQGGDGLVHSSDEPSSEVDASDLHQHSHLAVSRTPLPSSAGKPSTLAAGKPGAGHKLAADDQRQRPTSGGSSVKSTGNSLHLEAQSPQLKGGNAAAGMRTQFLLLGAQRL